ncbi:MAG TPA: hypothetical protein VMX14_13345 [Anaerolineae bacterium]|nr:hypothetical protein [Anaerolineae bacterium]
MPQNHRQEPTRARVALTLTALLAFGIAYNAIVTWLENRHHDRGYTSLLVIAGSAVTIAGAGHLTTWRAALWMLACFAASGAPMTAGSIWRYCRHRQQAETLQNHRALATARRRDHETNRPPEPNR